MPFWRNVNQIGTNSRNYPDRVIKMSNLKIWIEAFRLRTLPLAMSATILGSFLGYSSGSFKWGVFIFGMLTTLFLQVLSNLANDYGDALKGSDNEKRIGPMRVTSAGLVSHRQMRWMIYIFVFLSLVSGILLIWSGLGDTLSLIHLVFLLLGIAAIAAAIKYTVGKRPYGYAGLGDVMVFIFFGILGVVGTYFLHTHTIVFDAFIPAAAIGLFSVGVLNLNNMRDRENDKENGKNTLVVRFGARWAKHYHLFLILTGIGLGLLYTLLNFESAIQLLFLLSVPMLAMDVRTVLANTHPVELNSELKRLSLSTLLFSFSFGVGLIL